MNEKSDRMKIAILKVLRDIDGSAGASRITERLQSMGVNIRPRTVRFYLLQLDETGMTRFQSRRHGREITDKGRAELTRSNVMEKVGFVAAKIDSLGYRMSFTLRKGSGTIIANVAMIHRRDFPRSLLNMDPVFAANLGMGSRLALAREGEQLAGVKIPRGMMAFGTVCSVTMNGIMLDQRIPVLSRFGGLIEMRGGQPVRFVELIEYGGTTIDPLETFIRAGMTQVSACAKTGDGIIGASFREVPSVALDEVRRIQQTMSLQGLGGILAIGKPNRPLFDIPVGEGRAGIVVVAGLNPVAAIHEAGIPVVAQSLAGFEEFEKLVPFKEIAQKAPRRHMYME